MYLFGLHVKVLSEPWTPLHTLMDDMRLAFAPAGVDFEFLSREDLVMEHLTDLEVGACMDSSLTVEQHSLYSLRDGVLDGELVVYFVRSTTPFVEGCAAYSEANRPSAAVIAQCSRWALAHEVGHLLGLDHVSSPGSLMHDQPPASFAVPVLSAQEILTMQRSRYVRPV